MTDARQQMLGSKNPLSKLVGKVFKRKQKSTRLGKSKKAKRRREMIALYKGGATYKTIGEQFGVSKQYVHQMINKYASKHKRKNTTLTPIKCATCGKEFQPNQSTRKYCSLACSTIAQHHGTLMGVCIACGKKFTRRKSSRSPMKYCSRACYLTRRQESI